MPHPGVTSPWAVGTGWFVHPTRAPSAPTLSTGARFALRTGTCCRALGASPTRDGQHLLTSPGHPLTGSSAGVLAGIRASVGAKPWAHPQLLALADRGKGLQKPRRPGQPPPVRAAQRPPQVLWERTREASRRLLVNLKQQNREGKGPLGAPTRVARRMEGKRGDLAEDKSRGSLSSQPSAPSAPQCSRWAQSPPERKMTSGDSDNRSLPTQTGFSPHLSPDPALASIHLQEEPGRGASPQGPGVGACHSPSPVGAQTHMGPRLKSFGDRGGEKKSVSSASGEAAGVWIASPRLKETLLFFSFFSFSSFLQETKFSEFLSH